MNPAKAAPSAPVKKTAREDPQILPGGLLITLSKPFIPGYPFFNIAPTM